MSSTNANVNSNLNPVNVDMIQVKLRDDGYDSTSEIVKGWRNWNLQDIIRILKDMAKPEEYHGKIGDVMGNIVFRKLLEATTDLSVPFEVIEETVHTALEAPAYMRKGSVLSCFKIFGKQAVCDFFKEFVKRGIDDARYY